jgi:hypothetical protein
MHFGVLLLDKQASCVCVCVCVPTRYSSLTLQLSSHAQSVKMWKNSHAAACRVESAWSRRPSREKRVPTHHSDLLAAGRTHMHTLVNKLVGTAVGRACPPLVSKTASCVRQVVGSSRKNQLVRMCVVVRVTICGSRTGLQPKTSGPHGTGWKVCCDALTPVAR